MQPQRKQSNQLTLFSQADTLVSIDPTQNRYRAYQVEMTKTQPKTITKRWGRVEEKDGVWQLRKNKWQGEKEVEVPDDLDDFDSEDIYNQILEQKRKRGYVDYSELRFS